jgi:hypothetical protein
VCSGPVEKYFDCKPNPAPPLFTALSCLLHSICCNGLELLAFNVYSLARPNVPCL